MKKLKKYMIILGIILLILICTIITIHFYTESYKTKEHVADTSGDIKTEILKLNNYTTYNSIEKMMSNYYLYLNAQNKTAIYSLLDKDYSAKEEINEDNVISKISLIENVNSESKVEEIYIKDHLSYPTYFVKTNFLKENNKKLYYIFYTDNLEGAFSIQPINEEEYNLYVQGQSKFETKENKIEKNSYNTILRRSLEDEQIVQRYFEDYIQNALYNTERAYNLLQEEYREKKFGSLEEYKKYILEKHEQLTSMDYYSIKEQEDFGTDEEYNQYLNNLIIKGLSRYGIERYDDYTQYICVDEYGNYYIFNATAAFQYTVILDSYTIDIPQIVEKYNKSVENEKVQLNIQKLITATKEGDYKYVYSKLDNTFKSSNFPTQESFKNYIKEKYSEEDKIEFIKYEKINNVHVYDIEVTNQSGDQTRRAQIVMQLKEGTDFVMSFSANN